MESKITKQQWFLIETEQEYNQAVTNTPYLYVRKSKHPPYRSKSCRIYKNQNERFRL